MRVMSVLLAALLSLPLFAAEVRELTWSELIPEGALPAPSPMPMHDLSQLADQLAAEQAPPAAQQMPAAPVNKALDGQTVKLPGYLVPLNYDEDGQANEFLLVPYFGACIHSPPPPSNQIIHVFPATPLNNVRAMDAVWVNGVLETARSDTGMGSAGYRMKADGVTPYRKPRG